MNTQILRNRNAVIYGGDSSLGSTIGRAITKEGANVFLAGRRLFSVKEVADGTVDSGGTTEAATVERDGTKAKSMGLSTVGFARGERWIYLYCAVDYQVVQNIPLVRLSFEDFVRPVSIAMRSHFLTATATEQRGFSTRIPSGPTREDPECAHPIFWVTS